MSAVRCPQRLKSEITGTLEKRMGLPFTWQMALPAELRRNLLMLSFLITACIAIAGYAYASSNEAPLLGKILTIRKVLNNPTYFVSRYTPTHYYSLFIAVSVSNQTYCAEYTTPVLDEIGQLMSVAGMNVETTVKGNRLTLRTSNGKRFKTRLVAAKQCADTGLTTAE